MKKSFSQRIKEIGPGAVVAAAFIGPGTVTSCFTSGANFGTTLLWAILFSTISVIIMQSMASRLGIVNGKGLGESLRDKFTGKVARILLAILVIAAVFIGNVAYETGNIVGSTLGAQAAVPGLETPTGKIILILLVGGVSFALLISGSYKVIEKFLTALVVCMGIIFLVCALVSKPDWGHVFHDMFVPSVPNVEGGAAWMTVAALMGTTVVPYNIYLHASSSAQKWTDGDKKENVRSSLMDSVISIGLGGVISMAVIICASAVMGTPSLDTTNGATMAQSLEPLLGTWAGVIFGVGLFAAGFTSAITAPLAAAFASSGILGWGGDMKKASFKAIWIIVLLFGIGAGCFLGASPAQIILFAQAANAFLLPITAVLLLIVCNDKKIMGESKNGMVINVLAIAVICVFLFIATRNFTVFFQTLSAMLGA